VFSTPSGFIKYLHRDLEIEFLISEIGRGSDNPYTLKHLKSNAQRLRYLDILEKYPLEVDFYGIKITVPQPAAFVINKFIISQRRKNKDKSDKDIIAAKEIGEYILNDEYQTVIMNEIYKSVLLKLKINYKTTFYIYLSSFSKILNIFVSGLLSSYLLFPL